MVLSKLGQKIKNFLHAKNEADPKINESAPAIAAARKRKKDVQRKKTKKCVKKAVIKVANSQVDVKENLDHHEDHFAAEEHHRTQQADRKYLHNAIFEI